MRMRRVACSMTAKAYMRVPVSVDGFEDVGGEDGLGLRAEERRPGC
jgi:hypothetical protein